MSPENYFDHRITRAALVHWAEEAMQEGAFAGRDAALLRDGVARLGVAEVRAFGLTSEDCKQPPLPHCTLNLTHKSGRWTRVLGMNAEAEKRRPLNRALQ